MSSRSELARNNIRSGIFVTVAILLALGTIVVLSDLGAAFRPKDTYVVHYTVVQGVGGLSSGSDVRLGGMSMGRVIAITPHREEGQDRVTDLDVEFELDASVSLFEGCRILVNSALIGSESWLEIYDVGTGDPMAAGTRFAGRSAPPMLATLLGPDNADRADEIIVNATEFSAMLGRMPEDYDEYVKPSLENVKDITTNAQAVVSEFREEKWPSWADAVDNVAEWSGTFTDDLNLAVEDGRKLIGTVQASVDENRPGFKDTVENARLLTERLNTESAAKLDKLLDQGGVAMDKAIGVMETLEQDYDRWAVDVGDGLANASLAAQQLKLATIEVRRNPWKVLYRPEATELEHENLYEAARSFAMAAADLRATADAMERVIDRHGDDLIEGEPAFRRLRDNLDRSVDRYETAQQQLLDVLKIDAGQ